MLAQDGALLLRGIIIMPHQCSRAPAVSSQ